MIKFQRSKGKLDLIFKNNNIKKFYQKGASKAILPNVDDIPNQLILINTAGGITSGDEYLTSIELDNTFICTSTQAAEKIYKGNQGPGLVKIEINIKNNSSLYWMPQELILFNSCNFKRRLNINLSQNSNLLICESVIFGRTSMNEKFTSGLFSDFWKISNNNKLLHIEAINTEGYKEKNFSQSATFNNNCALNVIIGIGKDILKKG